MATDATHVAEAAHVSTGRLPVPERVRALLHAAHERLAVDDEGRTRLGLDLFVSAAPRAGKEHPGGAAS